MSAWIVTKDHIHVLVNAAVQWGLIDGNATTAQTTGQLLWQENHDSINHAYSHIEFVECPRYALVTTEAPIIPDAVFSATRCYDYQSSEHPAWETSLAYELCRRLDTAAAARGATEHGSRRYPWGFGSLDEAITERAA